MTWSVKMQILYFILYRKITPQPLSRHRLAGNRDPVEFIKDENETMKRMRQNMQKRKKALRTKRYT